MRFIARSATDRFVRIQLNADCSDQTLVALLGHELQHVVEVADHPEVQSPEDLRAFYRRTGMRTGPDTFDSEEARQTGYLVRAEIFRKPGDLRLARGASARRDDGCSTAVRSPLTTTTPDRLGSRARVGVRGLSSRAG